MKIAYVGPFSYPSSNANSLRVKGVADALVAAGHEVHICSSDAGQQLNSDNAPDGICVHYSNEYGCGVLSGWHSGLRGLFMGDATLRWLHSMECKPDAIILYGTHLGYLVRLLPFCKKSGILLILDVVEWYDPRHLPGGIFGPFALANEISMRFFARKADGIFAISRYLQEYFSTQGSKTLRLPPLFSFQDGQLSKFRDTNKILNLCYVGSPGAKEDMVSVFKGLQMAYDAKASFLMHVVGLTNEQFAASFGMQDLSIFKSGFVKFYGRMDNSEARKIVAACDFLVLLRKNERFSMAGFPSKVAESLCLGTPIIGNLSSNLDEYLIDKENSILVVDANPNAFFYAVSQAAQVTNARLNEMKDKALKAGECFRPKMYASKIEAFINETSC